MAVGAFGSGKGSVSGFGSGGSGSKDQEFILNSIKKETEVILKMFTP